MRVLGAIPRVVLALTAGVGTSFAQMTIVNGASYVSSQPMAPGSFATVFGENLCSQTMAAQWIGPGQLPTSLGGCSVAVNGTPAMMHYVSPEQINFVVPEDMGDGMADVVVGTGSGELSGSMLIGRAGPGVFAMNGMGIGEGAMLHGTLWQRGPFSVTTDGQPTYVSIFLTGLDPSTTPAVSIAGVPVEVTFWGNVPGNVGLQQINTVLPPEIAGAGRVPVTVTSNGQVSNVTYMEVLPTTEMMQGMPGWGSGMMVAENTRRGREASYMAFNPANNTVLVTDENDDAIRVISLDSKTTVATITLPADSEAHSIAVNETGTLAAVALSRQAAVALIDLVQDNAISVIGTGYYPARLAFSGTDLLVTNAGSGTVSKVDTNTRTVTGNIQTGFGPFGIAAAGNLAVVTNIRGGSLSLIDLTDDSVTEIPLPAGTRPHEAAISLNVHKALITTPMTNGFLILDLDTKQISQVETGVWNAMGPGAAVAHDNLAFVANQMSASVTVVDLSTGTVVKTFPVDPGPRALALNSAGDRLLALSEATGVLDIVDLTSYNITARINAVETEREDTWALPLISAINPTSGAAGGPSFTLTISGSNLQGVREIEFYFAGGGMMGGSRGEDPNIKVTNVQVNAAGTEVTATVQIGSQAVSGTRVIRLETDHGEMMGPMFNSFFTVTN